MKISFNCNGQIGKLETFWKVRDEISGKFSYMQSKESYFTISNREKVTVKHSPKIFIILADFLFLLSLFIGFV